MAIQFKKILPRAILAVIALAIIGWVVYHFAVTKMLQVSLPNGREVLEAGKTYQISWKARNIGKVAIVLIKGEGASQTTEYIAKDVSGGSRKYNWTVFVWQQPGQDYKLAIFEYPWKTGNLIDYSKDNFTILGPQFASCDNLAIGAEWPFLPSDYPGQRQVFITKTNFNGNLEGLAGADKKCQQEATTNGFEGNWKALLGDDETLAVDRLSLAGIFVEATPAATLPEGKTCHRLLGRSFDEFFRKFSEASVINQDKFGDDFFKNLQKVWLGRVNSASKRECLVFPPEYMPVDISRGYSFTTTCQNWTNDQEIVPGYPAKPGTITNFPKCYTPQGQRINAVAIAGLSEAVINVSGTQSFSSSVGKSCYLGQSLLCVQQ
jgi:hypothetical protein